MQLTYSLPQVRRWGYLWPVILCLTVLVGLFAHGPIVQFDHYHAFADQTSWGTILHARDVMSNLGFFAVGVWALWAYRQHWSEIHQHRHAALLTLILSILATSWCSSYYHLAPDDIRLFWDRLPIATACASLLALYRPSYQMSVRRAFWELVVALGIAFASVWWWQQTADLRPYLALQIFAIILPPCWQLLERRPQLERSMFGLAIACYVLAKIGELFDAQILQVLEFVSGHSLKHVLAAVAAYFILRPWVQPWRGV